MSLEDTLYPLLSLYERLPQGAKRVLGTAYRSLPVRWRQGERFPEFQALAHDVESWTPEQIRNYQTQQLRKVLMHAASHCPLYQARFAKAGFRPEYLREPEDLTGCPFLEKQDLLEHREELASTEIPRKGRLFITTGGSTGVPVGFYLQRGVSRPKEQAFLEAQWARGGYFEGARLAVIRGHVTSEKARGEIATYDATRDWLMLSSYHLTEARLPEYLAAIERFRPDLLHAYPSAALQLAEFLEKSGRPWRVPLKGLLAGSERLNLPQKRLLERVFQCRVYRWYGHSEIDPAKYRQAEEVEEWKKKDPLILAYNRIQSDFPNLLPQADRVAVEVESEIQDAVRFAHESPDPDPMTVAEYTYVEPHSVF